MKILITTAILIFTLGVYSQSTPDYSKIAKACELWGLIKYFHPDNPGSSFDSAFAASVPKMLTAVDDNEWKNILDQWLGVINDPNTNVKEVDTTILSNGNIESEFMKDSSLYIRISGGVDDGD